MFKDTMSTTVFVGHRMTYSARFSNYDAANMPVKASRFMLVQRLLQIAQRHIIDIIYKK